MPQLTFFPVGNADSCFIEAGDGILILFDYANMRCDDDDNDKRADLPAELSKRLEALERDSFDVVAFTHLDKDHICGAPDFFHLEHSKKHQGKERIKIKEMWVPAAVITEEGCEGDAKV